MKTRSWHKLITFLAIFAVALLYYNRTANWHYHITDNGIVIEHAHPFTASQDGDSPFQDHEHSDAEMFVLAQLMSSMAMIAVVLLALGMTLERERQLPLHNRNVHVPGDHCGPKTGRGPPLF